MAIRSITQLKKWFRRGMYPTESQFADWIDSFWHKEEDRIPMSTIEGLPEVINNKYPADAGKELEREVDTLTADLAAHKVESEYKFNCINEDIADLETIDEEIKADLVTVHQDITDLQATDTAIRADIETLQQTDTKIKQDITDLQAADAQLTQQIGTKADANHTHAQYAATDHNHTGVYQPAGDYAATNHTHTEYVTTDHTHTKAQITDFPTSMPASDVPAWAKAANKPTYTAAEVGAAVSGHSHADYVSTSDVRLTNARPANGGNADTVDGLHAASTGIVEGSKLVSYNSAGYITAEYFIQNSGNSENRTIGQVMVTNGTDNAIRKSSLTHFKNSLGSMPANGGNADTINGSPAYRLQSIQYDGTLYGANQYDIQSRFSAKGDGLFRLEVVGCADSANYRDRVSVGHADNTPNLGGVGATYYARRDAANTFSGYCTFVAGAGKGSDMRFKTVAGNITDALPAIKELDTFRYRWNRKGEEHNSIGVSAQQVQEYFPELVTEAEDADQTLTVDYNGLVPVCMQAIKELSARIEKLEDQTK